jgi:hypothetical protein
MLPDFIITPTALVHRDKVSYIDLTRVGEAHLVIHYEGKSEEVTGIQAIEILMQLRPSALEGHRMRWVKGAWILHNVVAHPVMQLLALFKLYGPAMWLHDATVPKPKSV